jgi:DNA-directed RNA polymerase subunit K/omega
MAHIMVNRPAHVNRYEFVAVCALRAQQLLAGCVPRVEGEHSAPTMAQMEVVAGRVTGARDAETGPKQCGWQR